MLNKPIFRFLFLLLFFQNHNFLTAQDTFLQKIQTTVSLPQEAGLQVLKLIQSGKQTIVVTTQGVFSFAENQWKTLLLDSTIVNCTQDRKGAIWVATSEKMFSLDKQQSISIIQLQHKQLRKFYWDNTNTLYVATNEGLYYWHNASWIPVQALSKIAINDLVEDIDKTLWVATADGLWQRINSKWINMDETLMAVGNERTYYALTTSLDKEDLLFSSPWSVGLIAKNGEHNAWTGAQGLPYGPVKVFKVTHKGIWMGTEKGVVYKDADQWHYYYGHRWLPDGKVTDLLEQQDGSMWIATAKGISEIKDLPMTLATKAAHYAAIVEARHNRRGLINYSRLKQSGKLSSSYTENEDNDGLWTACFLAAECYRYAVTKDATAKERAVRTFEALERLETITGISGYPARSYAAAGDTIVQSKSPHPKHWHLSNDKQWQWLDDTSSDEITGHFYSLSLFYELVASVEQKKRVVQLLDRIMTHIIDNKYHLIDVDGKPTRWGVWSPDSLNHASNWRYEKGLNSLQILSHLKTAYHYTQNPKYEAQYQYLIKQHGYAKNALEAKIYGPFETSHSDDILNFFPYYGILNYSKSDPYHQEYIKSLERSWKNVKQDHMPVWNVIASALLKKDCGLSSAKKELEEYPMDLIDWTMDNSHRWDLPKDPMVDRGGQVQALRPIPSPESSVSRWNTNPKRYKSGKDGMTEETGTHYLLAYWMGRYHGFFK